MVVIFIIFMICQHTRQARYSVNQITPACGLVRRSANDSCSKCRLPAVVPILSCDASSLQRLLDFTKVSTGAYHRQIVLLALTKYFERPLVQNSVVILGQWDNTPSKLNFRCVIECSTYLIILDWRELGWICGVNVKFQVRSKMWVTCNYRITCEARLATPIFHKLC